MQQSDEKKMTNMEGNMGSRVTNFCLNYQLVLHIQLRISSHDPIHTHELLPTHTHDPIQVIYLTPPPTNKNLIPWLSLNRIVVGAIEWPADHVCSTSVDDVIFTPLVPWILPYCRQFNYLTYLNVITPINSLFQGFILSQNNSI